MLAICFAETKSRFMNHMMFRAFQRNMGSGPKFHKKNQNVLQIHLVSYAKDVFLNCVCSRFVSHIKRAISMRYTESKIQAGATIHRKIKKFIPCIP